MRGLSLNLSLSPRQVFSPLSLPGLVFWAHADTLSSSPVSSWSYGAGNLTQGTGGSQPTWSSSSSNVGNKPSVLYNGSKVMSASNTSALQITGDITVCSVMYIVSYPAGFATVISKGVSGNFEFDTYISSAGTPTFNRSNMGAPVAFNAGTISTATKFIITYTSASNALTCYVNGTARGTGTGATATAGTNAVFIGQRTDAGTTLNGEQPETLLYNVALSAAQLTQLHRYFGAKYGISVP